METWLLFVVVAQFLNAVVVLVDKHVVTERMSRPASYAFFVSLMSIAVVGMIPFVQIHRPDKTTIIFSLLAAFTYIEAIIYLYKVLRRSRDASDVIPVAGAVTAISTFIFSFFILGEFLPSTFLIGSIFLVVGTLLISHFHFNRTNLIRIIISGLLLGLSSVFIKILFNHTSFADGFFWSRMANVVAAVTLLLVPGNFKYIAHDFHHSTGGTKGMILLNKIVAGIAAILVLYSIKLSNASVVNALSGLQYVFLLLFAFFFSKDLAGYFSHARHSHEVAHKIFSTSLIIIGFAIFFI